MIQEYEIQDMIKVLRKTAKERETATAPQKNEGLQVIAKISRADADLMNEAAAALEQLAAQTYEHRIEAPRLHGYQGPC